MNFVKLAVLITIPAILLLVGGWVIGSEGLLFGTLVLLSLLSGFYWFSDKIVLKISDAEMLTVYHNPLMFAAIEEMSAKAGIPPPKVFSITSETPNAFSAARNPRNAAIIFTTGIKQLPRDELKSVVAHEIIHIKNRDAVVGSIAAALAGIFGIGIGTYRYESRLEGMSSIKKAFGIPKYLIVRVSSSIVQALIGASREYKADARAAVLTGNPLSLANAIRTMEKKKHISPLIVSPAIAHLFCVSPLSGGRLARLFNTHPPMEARIRRLELMSRRRLTS